MTDFAGYAQIEDRPIARVLVQNVPLPRPLDDGAPVIYCLCGWATSVEFGDPTHWLVGCRCIPRRRVGVVAFASINLIGFLPRGNLDLAELAVPVIVFGVVA